jgi:hypothetical protein
MSGIRPVTVSLIMLAGINFIETSLVSDKLLYFLSGLTVNWRAVLIFLVVLAAVGKFKLGSIKAVVLSARSACPFRLLILETEDPPMKAKTVFVCQSCGYESGKWLGKCPGCDA